MPTPAQPTPESCLAEPAKDNRIAVRLTPMEWTRLMTELKWLFCLCGHEKLAIEFYEKIGSELQGNPIKVVFHE